MSAVRRPVRRPVSVCCVALDVDERRCADGELRATRFVVRQCRLGGGRVLVLEQVLVVVQAGGAHTAQEFGKVTGKQAL